MNSTYRSGRVLWGITAATLILFFLLGCSQQAAVLAPAITSTRPPSSAEDAPSSTQAIMATSMSVLGMTKSSATPMATADTPISERMEPALTPTPALRRVASTPCGLLLPILPGQQPVVNVLKPDDTSLAALYEILPEAAVPALERLLTAPGTVGLAAYRVGEEDRGAYLNADVPMPLASVVKIIHLVAYVEAVALGRLDPNQVVPLEDLDRYYLPGLDLGAHNAAIRELRAEGRILSDPEAVRLEEVPWMMIRHSSNAATDYLHFLLGQEKIEETAVSLGLVSQTAPCPFLGQFLIMDNHTRQGVTDSSAILDYLDDPALYGSDVMLLAEDYSQDANFRAQETSDRRRPSISTQRLFSENLNSQASARDYAGLMALIAQNGLSNAESSYLARLYLEWPMRFPANQELFSNLGYKNGSLPGILTTVYYAYPIGETTPVVVALFYRDLPNRTYQRWRRNELAHDELARWLLYDASAIPALRSVFEGD